MQQCAILDRDLIDAHLAQSAIFEFTGTHRDEVEEPFALFHVDNNHENEEQVPRFRLSQLTEDSCEVASSPVPRHCTITREEAEADAATAATEESATNVNRLYAQAWSPHTVFDRAFCRETEPRSHTMWKVCEWRADLYLAGAAALKQHPKLFYMFRYLYDQGHYHSFPAHNLAKSVDIQRIKTLVGKELIARRLFRGEYFSSNTSELKQRNCKAGTKQ